MLSLAACHIHSVKYTATRMHAPPSSLKPGSHPACPPPPSPTAAAAPTTDKLASSPSLGALPTLCFRSGPPPHSKMLIDMIQCARTCRVPAPPPPTKQGWPAGGPRCGSACCCCPWQPTSCIFCQHQARTAWSCQSTPCQPAAASPRSQSCTAATAHCLLAAR